MVSKHAVSPGPKRPPLIPPRTLQWLLAGFYVVLALLFLADGVYHRHAIFPWEEWFGFYAVFGFVACVMLVLVAKHLLRPIVMRDEEYYDR